MKIKKLTANRQSCQTNFELIFVNQRQKELQKPKAMSLKNSF